MQKVNVSLLVQNQTLKTGANLSHQTKAKLPYLTLSLKCIHERKNTPPDFEPVCEANISRVVFFSEDKVKKKLLNLNPDKSPGADNLHPRILKELSVSLSVP